MKDNENLCEKSKKGFNEIKFLVVTACDKQIHNGHSFQNTFLNNFCFSRVVSLFPLYLKKRNERANELSFTCCFYI